MTPEYEEVWFVFYLLTEWGTGPEPTSRWIAYPEGFKTSEQALWKMLEIGICPSETKKVLLSK